MVGNRSDSGGEGGGIGRADGQVMIMVGGSGREGGRGDVEQRKEDRRQ